MQTAIHNELDGVFNEFLLQQKLPDSYRATATQWFVPILDKLASLHNSRNQPIVIGINGCQGSGKSTLAAFAVAYFKAIYGKTSVAISIDDFYLTVAQRKQLADKEHALLLTRGVPGTHDMPLATQTLDALLDRHCVARIPRFNKAIDDREPESQWQSMGSVVPDIVIIEGWCMGSVPQSEDELVKPVNELEEFEDRSGKWRRYVNQKLAKEYAQFFARMDYWLMLKAPSFDSVYRWRLEQEEKLRDSLKRDFLGQDDQTMSPQQIRRFIQYYQRVTDHTLRTLPATANVVFHLDTNRAITQMHDEL